MLKIYTRGGDDGTTALRVGGRVAKDDAAIELVGAIDEAQAALGLARAESAGDDALSELLALLERDLWILMAEVMTAPDQRARAVPGVTAVTVEMVLAIEMAIDKATDALELEPSFAVPGETRCSALLDFARTVVRRAERRYVALAVPGSHAGPYLNRLGDLCWALARAEEREHRVNRRALSQAAQQRAMVKNRAQPKEDR